ncbi:hypothetical protein FRB90_002539 [Tulasnella sp. 427]|nr:hypothetical protein FRB90_002539 [Tulasnella sp. 427]
MQATPTRDHPLKQSSSHFAEHDHHETQGRCRDNRSYHLVPPLAPGNPGPLQHQTIGFSNLENEGKDLAAERRAADAAAVAAAVMIMERKHLSPAVKEPLIIAITNFLKPKPVAETIVNVEDEELDLDKNGGKTRKTEGRGPIEWIIAVDAAIICSVVWAVRLAALELKKVEADAAAAPAVAEAAGAAEIAEVAAETGISLVSSCPLFILLLAQRAAPPLFRRLLDWFERL